MGFRFFDSEGRERQLTSLSDIPVGTVVDFAGTTVPTGWLRCDGSNVSRTGFAELFAVLGTYYGTGDGSTTFTLPNISGSLVFAVSLAKRLTLNTPPQYVTSLPVGAVDGQEIYYAADATNGVIWHLRYRAASSSSYKWEFVGGPDLSAIVTTQQSRATNSYGDLTTSGPSVTVPLAGDYKVQVGAVAQTPAGTGVFAVSRVSYQVGSTAAVDSDGAYQVNFWSSGGATLEGSICGPIVNKTGIAASTAVTVKYLAYGGTHYFANRWITVIPVRVG